VKRLLDFLVALLGLVVAAPLGLVIALLIRLDSTGSILFRQVRVGVCFV
jgi:lipopolysaccharide/colanic/teichoic acid biosynthesis glycosyltransferase